MVCNLPWLGTSLCHYCHGTQAQWSKGAQGFQACLVSCFEILIFESRWSRKGYYSVLWSATLPSTFGWQILHWTGPLKPWRHHGVNRKLWEPYTRERGYLVITRRNMLSWVHLMFCSDDVEDVFFPFTAQIFKFVDDLRRQPFLAICTAQVLSPLFFQRTYHYLQTR